jgi:hypothetical protein
MGDESIKSGISSAVREASSGQNRSLKEGNISAEDEAKRGAQKATGHRQEAINSGLVFFSCRTDGKVIGVAKEPRKRLRVWIENFLPNGSRMTLESIELDRSEAIRLLQRLKDYFDE